MCEDREVSVVVPLTSAIAYLDVLVRSPLLDVHTKGSERLRFPKGVDAVRDETDELEERQPQNRLRHSHATDLRYDHAIQLPHSSVPSLPPIPSPRTYIPIQGRLLPCVELGFQRLDLAYLPWYGTHDRRFSYFPKHHIRKNFI